SIFSARVLEAPCIIPAGIWRLRTRGWELVPWIGRSSLAICVRPWINFRFPKKNDLKSLLLSKARGPPSLKNNMKSRRNKKGTGYFSGAKRGPRCPGCGALWPFLGEIEVKQEADVLRPMPGHH